MTDRQDDILIVGGGHNGMIAAAALAGAGLGVTLVDRADPETLRRAGSDGRTTALSHASTNLMGAIGLWDAVAPGAAPILDIRVTDGDSLLFVHYDHADLGDAPLGHIVENWALWDAAYTHLEAMANVTYLAPATVRHLTRDANGAVAELSDGTRLAASLVLGCDGRHSALRGQARIPVARWDYRQTAIVLTVAHENPHGHIAHERFLPAGPFAILPMRDDADGRHLSSVVWTERADLAPALLDLPDDLFHAELARRFGDFLGSLEIVGRRWSYPLAFLHANRYIDTRLALVGDAAHAMHPIAGQGLNMGLRDIAALTQIVVEARRLGLDIGDAGRLARYQSWRRFDNTALMFVTDGLNRLFSNNIPPVKALRELGLGLVNKTPPLRRLFMRHAMGLAGDTPKLLRGEPV